MSQQEIPLSRPQLAISQVRSALTDYLGEPVTAIGELTGSVDNQDLMIHTAGGDYIFKASDAASLTAEAWAGERIRAAGVPAPEIVGLEVDRRILPAPFLLQRRMSGTGLNPGPHPTLVEAGRQLRIVHSLSADGYGVLRNNPTVGAGPHDSWAAFTAEPLHCLAELVAHQVISEPLAQQVDSTLRTYQAVMMYDTPGVLLHGDLKPPHVFVHEGQFVGFIDWGDVAAGDPMYDLARFSINDAGSLEPLLAGYGRQLDDRLSTLFAVYRIVRLTMTLRDELRAGGDWFAAYRGWIEADLKILH